MTLPWLMNCAHRPDGWCLACVRQLGNGGAEAHRRLEEVERALESATTTLAQQAQQRNGTGTSAPYVPTDPGAAEIRMDGAELDEVCGQGVDAHLENLDTGHWFLEIGDVAVWLHSSKMITATFERRPRPAQQRNVASNGFDLRRDPCPCCGMIHGPGMSPNATITASPTTPLLSGDGFTSEALLRTERELADCRRELADERAAFARERAK